MGTLKLKLSHLFQIIVSLMMCYLAFKLLRLSRQIKREKLDEVVRQHRRKYGVNDCVNAAARQVSGGRNVSKNLNPCLSVCLCFSQSFTDTHTQTHTPRHTQTHTQSHTHIHTHIHHTHTQVNKFYEAGLGYAGLC